MAKKIPPSAINLDQWLTPDQVDGLVRQKRQLEIDGHACIDLRSVDDFSKNAIIGFASIAVTDLIDRIAELPTKRIQLILMGIEEQIIEASAILMTRKYNILQIWLTDELNQTHWSVAKQNNLLNEHNTPIKWWTPNLFLTQQMENLDKALKFSTVDSGTTDTAEGSINKETSKRVLDLGCGSGREAVYLASQNWCVDAIDKQAECLKRCQTMAHFNQVSVNPWQLDLKHSSDQIKQNYYHLVLMFRFLDRDLFPLIKRWLVPGGVFVCETFSKEAAKFGKPKKKSLLLEKGELMDVFSGWENSGELYRNLSDSRPVIGFYCQKPR